MKASALLPEIGQYRSEWPSDIKRCSLINSPLCRSFQFVVPLPLARAFTHAHDYKVLYVSFFISPCWFHATHTYVFFNGSWRDTLLDTLLIQHFTVMSKGAAIHSYGSEYSKCDVLLFGLGVISPCCVSIPTLSFCFPRFLFLLFAFAPPIWASPYSIPSSLPLSSHAFCLFLLSTSSAVRPRGLNGLQRCPGFLRYEDCCSFSFYLPPIKSPLGFGMVFHGTLHRFMEPNSRF